MVEEHVDVSARSIEQAIGMGVDGDDRACCMIGIEVDQVVVEVNASESGIESESEKASGAEV